MFPSRYAQVMLALTLAGAGGVGGQEAPGDADRQERAEAILQRAQLAMGRDFDPAFRAAARARLAALPLEELERRQERGPSAGLGGANAGDLAFRSLTPCRLVDTRAAGGSLAVGAPRDFKVAGTGLQGQGGSAAGCGVPVGGATAAVVNFVAVNPVGQGNLRAWAYSEPPVAPPNASIVNYASIPGSGLNIANGVVVPLCDPGGTTCTFDIRVQADGNGTHVVADVLGYFTPLSAGPVVFAHDGGFTETSVFGAACTPIAGAELSITVPSAGKISVHATVVTGLHHTLGTRDVMALGLSTSPANCNFTSPTGVSVAAELPTSGIASFGYVQTVPVAGVFNVAAGGTYTFYLNAFMLLGGDSGDFVLGGTNGGLLEATFHATP